MVVELAKISLSGVFGGFLLGLEGWVIALVCTSRHSRGIWQSRVVDIENWSLTQLWTLQFVVCAFTSDGRVWLFRDEFCPADWARLRRSAIRQCPREPVGLSMSR